MMLQLDVGREPEMCVDIIRGRPVPIDNQIGQYQPNDRPNKILSQIQSVSVVNTVKILKAQNNYR